MITRDREIVAELGEAIAQRIGEPRYQLWFADKTKFSWQNDELRVGVSNRFALEWLEKKFGTEVTHAATAVLGRPLKVSFAIDPQLFQAARRNQAQAAPPEAAAPEPATQGDAEPVRPALRRPQFFPHVVRPSGAERRWRQLSDFVVGRCNRVAHAAALCVIESPQQAANPLVFHGPVGTGKTHLLEGIYSGLRREQPHWHVCYLTAEEFTNRFLQAMHSHKLASFRKHFRECDALLVDNLQFVSTKRATQEEFLHTFDALHAHGKQLVVACDGHPRLAGEFSPELTDRLLGGAIWALEPTDPETRHAILRSRSGKLGMPIADEVLRQLAEMLRGNVRELEGALTSIVHYSRVSGRAPDLQLIREALGDHLRHSLRVTRIADVDRAVCQVLGLDPGTLQSKQRNWSVSHPRMLAMYLCRKFTSASHGAIGAHFGGLNHSSVVAAEHKVRRWLDANAPLSIGKNHPPVRQIVELVERELSK